MGPLAAPSLLTLVGDADLAGGAGLAEVALRVGLLVGLAVHVAGDEAVVDELALGDAGARVVAEPIGEALRGRHAGDHAVAERLRRRIRDARAGGAVAHLARGALAVRGAAGGADPVHADLAVRARV